MSMSDSVSVQGQLISVGLLTKEGKVLLGLRDSDKNLWEFPGGSVEWGEQAQETLVREFKEELGIKVLESKLLNILCDYNTKPLRIIVFFHITKWSDKIKRNWHKELCWFSPEECIGQNIPNINPQLFEQIMNIIRQAVK